MDEENKLRVLLQIISIVLVVRKVKNKNKRKRTKWSRRWLLMRNSGRDITQLVMNELRLEDLDSFQNFTRMRKDTFFKLLGKVEPMIQKQDTVLRESIPATTRLLITLRYLATGQTYRSLSYDFRTSVPAISKIVPETLKALCDVLKNNYLKMPNNKEEWKKIAQDFYIQWNFPHCLGALDGKHVAFRAKKKDGSFYFNYKGFHSIILLALVDANYCFLYVDVGCNGRVNDAGVYASSTLCKGIEDNLFDFPEADDLPGTSEKLPYVLVADEAFRLTAKILKPYGQRSCTENKVFNYRLSRARRVVENAFGILANKFQILQKDINLDVHKVQLVTLTACILHNYIRKEDGIRYVKDIDRENTNEVDLTSGTWRNNVFLTRLQKPSGNRSGDAALEIRDKFTKYFNTTGYVRWQWEAIKKFNF